MKAENLLDAIGMIDDVDILDAKEPEKTAVGGKRVHNDCSVKKFGIRKAIGVAAAIAVVFGSFATAMAVNEDFREAVYSFFHISSPDVVLPKEDEPGTSNDLEIIHEKNIEDAVNVEYVKINGSFDYGKGLIYLYGETEGDNAFYTVKDDKLNKLETNITSLDYTWKDTEYDIKFSWCEEDGAVYVYSAGKRPANDDSWYVKPIKGRTDAVTLTLCSGRQDDYSEYTFLLNLNTKKVTDIFAGCGVDHLSGITSTAFSKDMAKALITFGDNADVYYCDISAKTMRTVSELAGVSVNEAWFSDENTIFCYAADDDGKCTCWEINPSTDECTLRFEDLPIYSRTSETGIIFTGTRYGLYVDSDKAAYVYDFKTGRRTIVEGLTYSGDEASVIMNEGGTKMMYAQFDRTSDGLSVSQLGVIDIENCSFTVLDRKGYDIRDEVAISWFDNDRISVLATDDSGEKYLYLYSFIK